MKKANRYIFGIAIGLTLAALGYFISDMVKTNYGDVRITEVQTISASGFVQSMNVYVPESVTAKNPGPTIIVQHGGNNAKEEMKLYSTELARRGYVVIANDMYGMGRSQPLPDSQWLTAGRGLYDAVKYARTLPFVDVDRIGLLGYSRGSMATQESMQLDNKGNNYIKHAFLIFSDPVVRNKEGFTDIFGSRNVELLADLYDEFFFSEKANNTGVYSNDANKVAQVLSSSVGFADSPTAQAFLHFGDPTGKEARAAGETYEKKYDDGALGTRRLVTYYGTHMEPWFSPYVVEQAVTFFGKYMPSGSTLANNDFIYKIDNVFSLLGIFGLLIFTVSLALFLVFRLEWLKDVFIARPELRETGGAKGVLWLWGLLLGITVLGVFAIRFLNSSLPAYKDGLFPSSFPLYSAMVSALIASAALVACLIWYLVVGKGSKNADGSGRSFDLQSTGIFISGKQLLKTFFVAALAVFSLYLVVFAAKYLVNGEFYFIYWHIIPFGANRIPGMLAILPIMLLAHVTLSICANCFNYSKALSPIRWLNHILFALIASLPSLLVIIYVYSQFAATGWNPMFGGLASAAVQVLTMPVLTFFAIICARFIYDKTGNPYLGGIINGMLITIIAWSVCEIRVAEAGKSMPVQGLPYLIIGGCFVVVAAVLVCFYKNRQGSTHSHVAK